MSGTSFSVATAAQLDAALQAIDAATTAQAFSISLGADITLDQALLVAPVAGVSITVDGGGHALDGGGRFQGFFVAAGTLMLNAVAIDHAVATGGAGGPGSGGGAGFGGGLFVASGATVSLEGVSFAGDAAVGGAGGIAVPGTGGSGGSLDGGLGGTADAGGTPAQAQGGFGGGGAASGNAPVAVVGFGQGGFGGGGGGSNTFGGWGSAFGGGAGAGSTGISNQGAPLLGGGGMAAGADVFVENGGVLMIGAGTLGAGTLTAGAAGAPAKPGIAGGDALFIQGNTTVTLDPPAGQTLTIGGSVADPNGLTAKNPAVGADSILVISGDVVLAADAFTGSVTLSRGATLDLSAVTAMPAGIAFNGLGTLLLPGALLPTTPAGPVTVTNWQPGDSIDLPGLAAGSGAGVLDFGGEIPLTAGATSVDLTATTDGTLSYAYGPDGHGGTMLTASNGARSLTAADGATLLADLQLVNGDTLSDTITATGLLNYGTMTLATGLGGSLTLTAGDLLGVLSVTSGNLLLQHVTLTAPTAGGTALIIGPGVAASLGGVTVMGAVQVDSGGTLTIVAGGLPYGTITGTGALVVNGASLQVSTPLSLAGGVRLTGAATLDLTQAAAGNAGSAGISFSHGPNPTSADQNQVTFEGTVAPNTPIGPMTTLDQVLLPGFAPAGASLLTVSANHSIGFALAGGGTVTLPVDASIPVGGGNFVLEPNPQGGSALLTGEDHALGGLVTVQGAGGSVFTLGFDDAAQAAQAQGILDPINAAVRSGSIGADNLTRNAGVGLGQPNRVEVLAAPGLLASYFPASFRPVAVTEIAAVGPATILGGGPDGELVVAGQGGLTFQGGAGSGTVLAGGGANNIGIQAGGGSQMIATGSGDDTILALGGNNTISAGLGANAILTGNGANLINSTGQDLIAYAGTGSATIIAGANNPTVYLGPGGSRFQGGSGHATVVGGSGADTLLGAGGTQFWLGSGPDQVTSNATTGTGADTIIGGSGAASVSATSGNDFVFAEAGPLTFTGGSGSSTVLGSTAGSANIVGGAGSVVALSYRSTTFTGGPGAATVAAFAGSLTAIGGAGTGVFLGGPGGHNLLQGGSGTAVLFGGGSGDLLVAGSGPGDALVAGGGAETLTGAGTSGAHSYFGGSGADLIVLGAGASHVLAGSGSSTMVAGSGLDLFAFGKGSAGSAIIAGFNPSLDYLSLPGFAPGEANAALAGATTSGGSEALRLSDGTSIVFQGFTGVKAGNFQ